jgi:hypothetical protein
MLVGVQSDEYIRKNCWEYTAPMDFRKRIGKPIRVPAQGNMRRDFSFPQQQPESVMNLATNIVSITPRKNRPANADIVSFVTESLMKQEEPVKEEPEFLINYNPTYVRQALQGDIVENIPIEELPSYVGLPVPFRLPQSIGQFTRREQAALRSGDVMQAEERGIIPSSARGARILTEGAGAQRGLYARTPDFPAEPQPVRPMGRPMPPIGPNVQMRLDLLERFPNA